jgi:predicted nucleotide-binding protein
MAFMPAPKTTAGHVLQLVPHIPFLLARR